MFLPACYPAGFLRRLSPTVVRPRCNSPINRFCILATRPPPLSRGRLLRAMIDTVKYGVLYERRDAGVASALSTYPWGHSIPRKYANLQI